MSKNRAVILLRNISFLVTNLGESARFLGPDPYSNCKGTVMHSRWRQCSCPLSLGLVYKFTTAPPCTAAPRGPTRLEIMLAHQTSSERNLVECLEQNTASRDNLRADSPSPQYSTECVPSLPYQYSDLSVFGLDHHVDEYNYLVDTSILDVDSPWTPLGMTASEDMNRRSLGTFNTPEDWDQQFSIPEFNGHPNGYLDISSTLFMPISPSTRSIHTGPFYPASAPTPHQSWDSLTPQPFALASSDNMSQASTLSVGGDDRFSILSHSLMHEATSGIPRRSETWSNATGKPFRIRCLEPDCNKDFTLRKDLRRHIHAIHERKTWECEYPDCSRASRGFSRKDKLMLHMRTHSEARHSTSQASTTTSAPTEDHTAREYDATLRKSHTWSDIEAGGDHSSKSGESKPYICLASGCGRHFVNQHDLARHERTMHTEQNSRSGYRCTFETCSKRDKIWNRLDNFKKHLREQHKLDNVQPFVERSSRMNAENHGNAPFDVTTPEAFSKKVNLG